MTNNETDIPISQITMCRLPRVTSLDDQRFTIVCTICGESSSANPSDYWQFRDDQPLVCGCDMYGGSDLVEKRIVHGITAGGEDFVGSVNVTIKRDVTVGDLRELVK